MSPFSWEPRITGRSGLRARLRKASTASMSTMSARSSLSQMAIFWISWEVRKPSKKLIKGTRPLMAARWATAPRSMTSWGLDSHSMAKPVWRQAMTSEWSPKMFSAWVATVRADT